MACNILYGGFHTWGVPLIIHLNGILTYTPSSYWGTPMTMEPPTCSLEYPPEINPGLLENHPFTLSAFSQQTTNLRLVGGSDHKFDGYIILYAVIVVLLNIVVY